MERAQKFMGGFLEDIKSSDPDKIDWEHLLSEEFLDSFYYRSSQGRKHRIRGENTAIQEDSAERGDTSLRV